jgi:hypothetical protein
MAFRSGLDPMHVLLEVRRLVPAADQEAAIALLNQIQDLGCDVVWVQLAALNLSGGRVDLLPRWIKRANVDPRDLQQATMRHLDPMWDAKYKWSVKNSE